MLRRSMFITIRLTKFKLKSFFKQQDEKLGVKKSINLQDSLPQVAKTSPFKFLSKG